ncbi:MAG: DUF551 domain-containing protein [Erysipelotrichaceae bacterium]|nr:DUF551 domain-containing protein [Erysipelotrichaceae bacterium]
MIDEKKLIEELRKYADELGTVRGEIELANGVLKAISIINEQPKVGEWIPVEERLPEIFENVLIYTKSGHYHIGAYFEERKRWWLGVYWEDLDFILAWMPLPKPYEVKENE